MAAFIFIRNLSRATQPPARIRICDSFATRLGGLMFRTQLAREDGVLLVGARDARLDSAIHMLFVPFVLAVFWINSGMEVVDKVVARAWRPAYVPSRPARYVLELHPDLYDAYEIGNKVEFVNA